MRQTCDAFLGGRLQIAQPARGFRAGVDAVLLAAACPAQAGESVLELGCGVGVASLCLGHRVAVRLSGVEVQAEYAALARGNGPRNGIEFEVFEADLRALPAALRQRSFHHVIANPPYFDRKRGNAADDAGRDMALGGQTPLADWLAVAAKRLRPKGYLTMIQRMERLPEMLAELPAVMGSAQVLPIAARQGSAPHLVLLQARKEGRALFRMAAPFVMHEGLRHEKDGEDYTEKTRKILREGHHLPIDC